MSVSGKGFNLSGDPDVLRNSGDVFSQANPGFEDYPVPSSEQALGFQSSDLENWYRGDQDQSTEEESLEKLSLLHPGHQGQHQKIKSFVKSSLQVVTVAILIITVIGLGGFIFLDRKINLEATQASLNRMSGVLGQEGQASEFQDPYGLNPEDGPLVPQVEAEREARIFNTSGNTNVSPNPLPPDIDTDQDGLSDEVEERMGTNPFMADSDGDGYPDGTEVENGYDPLTPALNRGETGGSRRVASASSCALDQQEGSGSCSVSQDSYLSASSLSASSTTQSSFDSLSADEYSTLQQFGLSEEDINRASSGDLNLQEKISMQEKILSSTPMQQSIDELVENVPKAALPNISDSDLNLYPSNKKEDIVRYFNELNAILEGNVETISHLNGQEIQKGIMQNDYSQAIEFQTTLENIYQGIKSLAVPQDAKEVQKVFLSIFRIYADITSAAIDQSDDPNNMTLIFAQMKSFEDLQALAADSFQDLSAKYDLTELAE